MNLPRTTSLARRLGASYAYLLTLLLALAGLGSYELLAASARLTQIVDVQEHRIELARDLLDRVNDLAVDARTIALLTEMSAIDTEMQALKKNAARYLGTQQELTQLLNGAHGSDAERELLAQIIQVGERAMPALMSAAQLGADGDNVAATLQLTQQVRPQETAWRTKVAEFVSLQGALTAQAVADAGRARGRAFAIGAALLALALASGAWVAWRITRSIQLPLAQALAVAQRIAQGDLSAAVPQGRSDELGQLLQAVATMQQRLRDTVGEIRRSAESIHGASCEVASGNLDLSRRTEQAASSLQRTAGSMEQLTAALRGSADSALQADQLAADARQVARRGGAVVAEVVATMEEINHASRRIADIIGTIDGIAFQTNILALNAAVEAARAGEQGRGFAVVASEVRSLAQRSAAAAREIKGLIGTSVDRVETGARLVGSAGHTMGEIVASVQRVSDIIGRITASAGEQSAGIGQVNAAVTQLDGMTQQNAALVEQGAAAAESLQDQAQRLNEVVGVFRLADA